MRNLEDEKRFSDARKQLVVKRVDAIQLGRNSFSLVETKVVNYMLSKIKPTDKPDTEYIFNIKEFCRMIQWHRLPTNELLKILQTLANKSWWIKTDADGKGPEYELRHWFDVVRLNEGRGTITITFSQTVVPYIFNLLEQQKNGEIYIASWTADAISLMKNPYAPRIFELLRTYEFNNEEWRFENGTGTERDLQVIIADRDKDGKPLIPQSWSNWSNFERNVLAPAKKEINKYTDLTIDYEPLKVDFVGKKYRKYVSILFRLSEKTIIEKEFKDRQIAIEYDNVISEQEYQQISISDFQRERNLQAEIEKSELESREIDKSKYPLLKSLFIGLNEAQLAQLYKAAREHMMDEVIDECNRDLWVADYISEYYDYIESTPEQTKTTVYARLYDCVKHDYKNYSYRITVRYDNSIWNNRKEEQKQEIEYSIIEPADVTEPVQTNEEIIYEEADDIFTEKLMDMVRKIGK